MSIKVAIDYASLLRHIMCFEFLYINAIITYTSLMTIISVILCSLLISKCIFIFIICIHFTFLQVMYLMFHMC